MADEETTEEEARRLFAACLVEMDARGPAPDCEGRSAAIDAECDPACGKVLAEDAARARSTAIHR